VSTLVSIGAAPRSTGTSTVAGDASIGASIGAWIGAWIDAQTAAVEGASRPALGERPAPTAGALAPSIADLQYRAAREPTTSEIVERGIGGLERVLLYGRENGHVLDER
jgi:hypothetical protein